MKCKKRANATSVKWRSRKEKENSLAYIHTHTNTDTYIYSKRVRFSFAHADRQLLRNGYYCDDDVFLKIRHCLNFSLYSLTHTDYRHKMLVRAHRYREMHITLLAHTHAVGYKLAILRELAKRSHAKSN